MKQWLRSLVPMQILRWRQAMGWQWFIGDFATWAEARRASAGYDDGAVLARVLAATREVQAGRALWERDGVAFRQPQSNAPLLGVLKSIAAAEGGRLDLVDLGGALGSTWWQHRTELTELTEVRWRVVEQAHFVSAGREFADRTLSFHLSLDDAIGAGQPGAILFSSLLPYVEHPWKLLAEAVRRGFRDIIIDRTSFAPDGRERLVVQRTPPELGGGSYPCWIFNQAKLLATVGPDYALTTEWPGFDKIDPDVEYRGFHFQRIVSEDAVK